MKLMTTTQIVPRFHKRSSKASSYKRLLVNQQKSLNGSKREVLRETSPCDNSDDSGLGTDNNADYLYNSAIPHPSVFRFASSQKRAIENSYSLNSKRHRIDGIKEQNDLGDPYSFPLSHVTLGNSNSICVSNGMQSSIPSPSKSIRRSLVPTKRLSDPVTLTSQLSSTSRNGKVSLQIVNQPEQQHRARYQTEGSRGAVKDRTGNSFPIVKVVGYNRLTTLQVFIGSDQGRVAPHMFYQACRVTGKNSTPCVEKNVDGTVVIEIDVEPTKDMTVTCDCVGILKERNVDVEHRFPDECSTRSKKKSTRCRMVFRTVITNEDGSTETLQVASQPIACTQPPGVPEICKKSLTNCTANGGKELFILGKNFLKDTHVRFYTEDWEQTVTPDKEFLQQTHLVCVVPAYKNVDITEAVSAKITVISGNRAGEPHTFTYTPMAPVVSPVAPITLPSNPVPRVTSPPTAKNDSGLLKPDISTDPDPNAGLNGKVNDSLIKTPKSPTDDCENVHPVMLWPASNLSSPTTGNCSLNQNDSKMMPPPAMPLRRPSVQMIASDGLPSSNIKADVSNASSSVIPHFPNVAGNSLPDSLNQRAYLSPQYSAMSECAPMIAEYPSSYRTISEMKSDAVPKLEPLPDPPSLCSNTYQATSPDLDARSSQMCLVPSMKNSVTQCSDLYSNSHNYEYPSSNLYSGTMVKNESEARLSVEDLSAFATSRSAGNGLPFNSMSMLDGSNMGGMKLPCSQNALNGNDSSSYVVSPTFQMNSVMTHGNVLSSAATRSSYPKNDKILTLDLSDSASGGGACSSYNHNAKKKEGFQFDKLFEAKSQQALVSCSMKNSASYENARDAVCFKNTQSASEPNMPMYQDYLNLENARTLNSSESVRQSYNKLDENKMVASLDAVKSSMMLNEASSLMEGPTQMARKASGDAYALPVSKTYQTARSLNGADGSSLMNSQSEESVMNEFVSAPMVDNAINTVPKLEELVNCAAENHIRSANKSATSAINLLNNSAMSSMYLTNETSRANGNCNDMPNVISPSRTSVSENPLLACTDDLSSYQRATNASRNNIEATNATNKSSDPMEPKNMNVKPDKTVNVPGMTKKTEEGVFSSDISRMTETDLLSYINPSCFDEVQR